MRGRILVVDHQTPTPDRDSGSASTFAYLRILARSGLSVTFASPNLGSEGPYTQALNNLGITTPMAAEWRSLNAVIETLGPQTDVLLLYRGAVATHIFDIARRTAPSAKIVFHPVDLSFLRMEREATLTGDRELAEFGPCDAGYRVGSNQESRRDDRGEQSRIRLAKNSCAGGGSASNANPSRYAVLRHAWLATALPSPSWT